MKKLRHSRDKEIMERVTTVKFLNVVMIGLFLQKNKKIAVYSNGQISTLQIDFWDRSFTSDIDMGGADSKLSMPFKYADSCIYTTFDDTPLLILQD